MTDGHYKLVDGERVPLTPEEIEEVQNRPSLVEPPPENISFRQFFQVLALEGVITQDEALAAVRAGTIPEQMQRIVDGLPPDQQFAAKMLISGASEFQRHHPLVTTFAHAMGWPDAKIDELWRGAATL